MSSELRSTTDILADHLEQRRSGSFEVDLARNYAADVVLLTSQGVFRGHDGVRQCEELLTRWVRPETFECRQLLTEGDCGFLEWTAAGRDGTVTDGADSYVIRDGRIAVQTMHFTVARQPGEPHQTARRTGR